MQGILYEEGLLPFVILTCIIGGGMAFAAGGAVADGWKTTGHLLLYTLLLTLADRFLHYALFSGTLSSVQYLVIDFVVLFAFAYAGFRLRRRAQMHRQYGFRTREIGRMPSSGA